MSRTGANPQAVANAATVEGFFGVFWFAWGQQDPPRWLVPVLAVGSVTCGVVLVGGIVVRRRLRGPSPMADARTRRTYLVAVVVEAVLALGGALLLVGQGHPELVAGWVCLVVGAHFVPLATIFRQQGLLLLAVVVALVGLGAIATSMTTGVVSSLVAGPGAGLALLLHAAYQLFAARRAARRA